jgi:Domain of unknown function (DUF4411)
MYVLDANVFIEAKNKHYGFDFMPRILGVDRGQTL